MMFKTVFLIFLTLGIQTVSAAVQARWLTVTSVLLDDGKTKILFDPAWTRPGIKHWLNISEFKSDEKLVAGILKKNYLDRVDAVFASHSHFDHVMDAPMVSKLSGAVFYTDKSSERIAMAYKEPRIRTINIVPNLEIRVGNFLITPIPRVHSQILHLFYFLPGDVPEDTNLSFWDYHVGETWFYLVKHPDGNIVVDQGSEPHIAALKKHTGKVDVLIQGVANRKSDEMILDGYVKQFKPKFFMPLHFDNFFAEFNEGEYSDLPGVKLEQIVEKLKKAYPTMKVDRPLYGKPVTIL